MKWIVITLTILSSSLSFARNMDRQLIRCLGAEEKRFHLKKETGPIFDLNQRLINEMLQIPRIEISPKTYTKICLGKGSESLKLLEHSLLVGKKIFTIPGDVTGMQKDMTTGMIDDYIEATKDILLSLISQIQTISPTPHCLEEEIPHLAKFFNDVKYLQEDVDMKLLFKKHENKIFKSIENYPKAFQACRERLKKKLNSASTPEAKKP